MVQHTPGRLMIRLPCPVCHGTEFIHDGDRHTETRGDRCPNPDCYEGTVPARTGERPETSAGPGTDAMLNRTALSKAEGR